MVNGKTAVCGVIGNPVEHTLSPVIHNTLAKLTGKNLIYVPFQVDNQDVKEAILGADALNILGLNVTVPHKSAVIPYLSEVDAEAALIGAVNTLVRVDSGLERENGKAGYKGYNTDLPGLYRAMRSENIVISGEQIILLGAGGAARAAAFLCALKGAQKVYLLNRSLEKACQVAEEVNAAVGKECICPMALSDWTRLPDGKFLAIQGTSVGLAPNNHEVVIEDPSFYEKIHTGFDLVYRPAETKFMKLVKTAGGRAYNGLKMLLYQGIEAFELWNGVSVSEKQADICYEQMKQELENKEKNLILIGFMGSGKSTLGVRLSYRMKRMLLDTDKMIEKEQKCPVSEIFTQQGEQEFRNLETGMLKKLLQQKTAAIISTGGGLPVREENRRLLKQLGKVVYLRVRPETVAERLRGDTTRPLLQKEDPEAEIRRLLAERDPLYEAAADVIVDVDGKNFEQLMNEILKNERSV